MAAQPSGRKNGDEEEEELVEQQTEDDEEERREEPLARHGADCSGVGCPVQGALALTGQEGVGTKCPLIEHLRRHVAQWLERFLDTEEAGGSIPPVPTAHVRTQTSRSPVTVCSPGWPRSS